ncbi:MAG: NAD(P)-dependent oxidoreductase [Gammaproteobacteria bacterium]|jgi:nucleoside-diphosphate-sugar epimerase
MSKRVAITGASGFIGRTLCRILHDGGWAPRVLVRSPERARPLAPWIDAQVVGDLGDPVALGRLIDDSAAVVHCAGAVRGARQRAFDCVNVDGVANLIRAVRVSARPPRILCLSSLAAREPRLSFYAASKRRGEQVLEQQAQGLEWVVLRPPAVYGPGDRELLPLFRLMGRGLALLPGPRDARFSVLFVEDLAHAVLAWLEQGAVPNGVYSLHDGRPGGYSWNDACDAAAALCQRRVHQIALPPDLLAIPAQVNRALARWLGYAPMLTPEKLRELRHSDWVCDNDALQKVLDWRPAVQLEEGLRRTPGWCRRLDALQ